MAPKKSKDEEKVTRQIFDEEQEKKRKILKDELISAIWEVKDEVE